MLHCRAALCLGLAALLNGCAYVGTADRSALPTSL